MDGGSLAFPPRYRYAVETYTGMGRDVVQANCICQHAGRTQLILALHTD